MLGFGCFAHFLSISVDVPDRNCSIRGSLFEVDYGSQIESYSCPGGHDMLH